jgi:hypothetical protein
MRLAQASPGDAYELRRLQRLDRGCSAVPHRLPQPSDDLVQHPCERALVRDAPLDPFGHQLLDVFDVALEVAVLREAACLHGAQRPHAAVLLVALPVRVDHVTRRLVGASEHAAEHHGVGSGRDRLRHVSGRCDPAVSDHGNTVTGRRLGNVVDRRDLRHAHAGHHTRRADARRPDPHLDGIRARADQRLCGIGGRDVPGDHLELA